MFGWGRRSGRHGDELIEPWPEDRAPEEPTVVGGPYDSAEAPVDGLQRLDLGSVRLPVPEGSQLQVEVDPAGPVRAVHIMTQAGRLTISAFAAPKTTGLWHGVRSELAGQLRRDGARVLIEEGEWGPELVADTPKALLRFVGVDGPRWLLRGVAAGPGVQAGLCAKFLYDVIDGTVVVRGQEPLPVRTPLPIELPEAIARHVQQARDAEAQHAQQRGVV